MFAYMVIRRQGGTLVNTLGGVAGFGEDAVPLIDDDVTQVDLSSVFQGDFNFFGVSYSYTYIDTNGAIG